MKHHSLEFHPTFARSTFARCGRLKKNLALLFALNAFLTVVILTGCKGQKPVSDTHNGIDSTRICAVKFCADSAFRFVQDQCEFGPRVPNSKAWEQCGDYIAAKFESYGLKVTNQRTTLKAWDDQSLKCRNIIAAYRPELTERVILCAHYDSRPWADNDENPENHHSPVMAANDGASGVAVMMEIARNIEKLSPKVGVDFICFDLEDYGAPEWAPEEVQNMGDTWCMGSKYWSENPHTEDYAARYGILLDMVGGRGSVFAHEGFSLKYAQSIVVRTWEAARYAGAEAVFPQKAGGYITDDHVPMNEIAMIPTIDIIPFYEDGDNTFGPHWHTTHDVVENIDPQVLRAVGQTVMQLLSEEE